MQRSTGSARQFLMVGAAIALFGASLIGMGLRLDRPLVTMFMGTPFLVAGTVVLLLALASRHGE